MDKRILVSFTFFLLILFFSGCESKQTTAPANQNLSVNEQSIGMPFYPNAQLIPGSNISEHNTNENISQIKQTVKLTTSDNFDKVNQWYKEKLPADALYTPPDNENKRWANWGYSTGSDARNVKITEIENNKIEIELTLISVKMKK